MVCGPHSTRKVRTVRVLLIANYIVPILLIFLKINFSIKFITSYLDRGYDKICRGSQFIPLKIFCPSVGAIFICPRKCGEILQLVDGNATLIDAETLLGSYTRCLNHNTIGKYLCCMVYVISHTPAELDNIQQKMNQEKLHPNYQSRTIM